MKKLILVLIGFSPLALGYLTDFLLMSSVWLPFTVLGALVLVVWTIISAKVAHLAESKKEFLILINAVPLVFCSLFLIQSMIIGSPWANVIGSASQHFFTPLMFFTSLILPLGNLSFAIILSFLLMVASTFIGYNKFEKANKPTDTLIADSTATVAADLSVEDTVPVVDTTPVDEDLSATID